MAYRDDSIDLVYSISVIEPIHGNYLTAVREMARNASIVLRKKPGADCGSGN
jgi:hypothetical protein